MVLIVFAAFTTGNQTSLRNTPDFCSPRHDPESAFPPGKVSGTDSTAVKHGQRVGATKPGTSASGSTLRFALPARSVMRQCGCATEAVGASRFRSIAFTQVLCKLFVAPVCQAMKSLTPNTFRKRLCGLQNVVRHIDIVNFAEAPLKH